jgi:hypothetical protein
VNPTTTPRKALGAHGPVFLFGVALPTLWALWAILRIGVANSPLWGQQTDAPTYPRDMDELWGTAIILTVAAAIHVLLLIRPERLHVWSILLTSLAIIAATLNWAILVLP